MRLAALALLFLVGCRNASECRVTGEYVTSDSANTDALVALYKQVHEHLGANRGQLLRRLDGPVDLPQVSYEVKQPTLTEAPELSSLRAQLEALGKLERVQWQCDARETLAKSGLVARNFYFAKPGNEATVLATRREASRVRQELGVTHGDILFRERGDSLPVVLWSTHIAALTPELRQREARATNDPAFASVSQRMRALLDRFATSLWRVEAGP
jgi:hypothetical protein